MVLTLLVVGHQEIRRASLKLFGASRILVANALSSFRLHRPTLPQSFSAPLFLCVSRFLRVANHRSETQRSRGAEKRSNEEIRKELKVSGTSVSSAQRTQNYRR